jgi:hypothetical protein
VVDSEADKTMAGMKAREGLGSFGVDNELTIDHPHATGTSSRRLGQRDERQSSQHQSLSGEVGRWL